MCLDTRPGIWLEVADAAAWLQFRGAVGTYLLPSLWGSWVGVSGLTVGPGDMQAAYPLLGMAADLADLLSRDVLDFDCPPRPAPQGQEGGRGPWSPHGQ